MSTPQRRVQRAEGPPDPLPAQDANEPAPATSPAEEERSGYEYLRPLGRWFRWYDLPYVILNRLHYSKAASRLPVRWQEALRRSESFLEQTHYAKEFRRQKGHRDWWRIHLPDDEKIALPAVWVVEYFTASGVHRLYDSIRRAGWSAPQLSRDHAGEEVLASSRAGGGQVGWRIAHLHSGESTGFSALTTHRATLPPGVTAANIYGVPIGKGLTAVVVSFWLDESHSDRLNDVLHADHQAALIRRPGHLAVAQGPSAVLHHRMQRERTRTHQSMRKWMTGALPGTFARSGKPQPLFDLVFFDVADPLADGFIPARRENDAVRGIGVDAMTGYRTVSPDLPGLLFEPADSRSWAEDITANVWTLWGNSAVAAGLAIGSDKNVQGAAHSVGADTTDFMARTGLTALLRLLRENASVAHDNARKLHGGTSSRNLKRLRERTLTTSLDLATLEEDIKEYNGRGWRFNEPQFYMERAPSLRQREIESGTQHSPPIDLNKNERKTQKKLARELVAFDTDYREVLNTVASIGASLDSRRVQRVAVWISIASLGVALATLWATSPTARDLILMASDAISSWFS
ncbi:MULTISPECIES: hypothetical protein [unclassified Microbacterium]|uniref:hypothetical protein n=1 Tax=unclassified Microbacterium TaxID=2609290 RepID=UPI0012F716D7|nr:hypothetical protein [Microbacterium sp. MAH-37]MVQ44112.1 hypothetical protein [Microbacterium sp. MAH-37]